MIKRQTLDFLEKVIDMAQRDIETVKALNESQVQEYMEKNSYTLNGRFDIFAGTTSFDDEKTEVEEPEIPVETPQAPVEEPEIPVEEPEIPVEEPEIPVEETPQEQVRHVNDIEKPRPFGIPENDVDTGQKKTL